MPIVPVTPWLAHGSRNAPPTIIVLHATAGSTARSSVDYLRSIGLSYHYVIARDGRDSAKSENADGSEPIIFHCAPTSGRAFHVASQVPTPGGGACNEASIGISLANIQRRANPEPYPVQQIKALDELIARVKRENPTVRWLTTHAVVQPWNRADPLFIDGAAVARRHGLTWWKPTQQELDRAHAPKILLSAALSVARKAAAG